VPDLPVPWLAPHYFRLADPSVAEALEALARISPPEPIRSLRQDTRAQALRRARTCYNHPAGCHHPERADTDRLSAPGTDLTYRLTDHGRHELVAFGLDLPKLNRTRSVTRYCVDWSEQRHHLAGALGAALTQRMFDLDWIRRTNQRRAIELTDTGRHGLTDTFGVPANWDDQPERGPR
jgi:hypothetical protein